MNRIDVNERPADTERRIHAVPPTPMYQGETKILDSLWKEAQMTPGTMQDLKPSAAQMQSPQHSSEDNDRKLQLMIERYQKEVKQQQIAQRAANGRKTERPAAISHSQPCLIAVGSKGSEQQSERTMSTSEYQRRASASGEQPPEPNSSGQSNQRVPNNQKLIQLLREENVHMKKELDAIKRSLIKLQQIELSYERLEKEYDLLRNEKERQETLEMTVNMQLDKQLKRLTAEKEELQMRLENTVHEPSSMVANLMISEMQQKQELLACKERQQLEIEAMNQTLEEQRNHIAMLEKALANSQERLSKKEKKCEEMSSMEDLVENLQRQLQDVLSEQLRRDEVHSGERAQWEMEKTQLRMQLNRDPSLTGSLKRTTVAHANNEESLLRMRKSLHMRDERITQLERTVVELQKTLVEETDRRKDTLNSITESFEMRIKRLEEEKLDKEKRMSELRTEKDKLAAALERSGEDDAAMRDLHKMEDIRQRIQERRKKGRLGVTGGLMGTVNMTDHARSSSGSILHPNNLHLRSSSGPSFDPAMARPPPSIGYSHSLYKPT